MVNFQSFYDFLKEHHIPVLNLSRHSMPQIKDIFKFREWLLSEHSIASGFNGLPSDSIKPTQVDFDQTKVNAIMGKIADNKMPRNENDQPVLPVIVSLDHCILDGHHRYFAYKEMNRLVPVMIVAVNFNVLLKLAKEYEESDYDNP